MQFVNENKQITPTQKVYSAPVLGITYFYGNDVITASDPNDNNYGDIDWD